MYKLKSLDDDAPSVLLDPNEMSTNGTISLTSWDFSGDDNLVAYSFSNYGSAWESIKIRNVETGNDFPETLEGLKFSYTSWSDDSKGFFYSVK